MTEGVSIESSEMKTMPQIQETLTPKQQFEKDFFSKPWEQITGIKVRGIEDLTTSEEKSRALWEAVKPALDLYIEINSIPTERNEGESDLAFFTRVGSYMYGLNQRTKGCWKDSFPTTALEISRTNCALGSLVLVRALTKSGIPESELEYASPGPMSHAAIVARGYYIDQANGVVIPVAEAESVDGIKCYRLEVDETNTEVVSKVPFRLVPVSPVYSGVRVLVSNLDPMIEQATKKSPNPEAAELVQRFGIGKERVYGNYAYSNLLPPEWNPRRMKNQPEWEKETTESSARING